VQQGILSEPAMGIEALVALWLTDLLLALALAGLQTSELPGHCHHQHPHHPLSLSHQRWWS
jgi:hypothetical protein